MCPYYNIYSYISVTVIFLMAIFLSILSPSTKIIKPCPHPHSTTYIYIFIDHSDNKKPKKIKRGKIITLKPLYPKYLCHSLHHFYIPIVNGSVFVAAIHSGEDICGCGLDGFVDSGNPVNE